MNTLFQQGLDLLFPPRCAGCQRSGSLLCSDCWLTMQPLAGPQCMSCGSPLSSPEQSCPFSLSHRQGLHGIRYVNRYCGALRQAIQALKYDGQQRLARPLGLLMAEAWSRSRLPAQGIIPLPLHPERLRLRGFNQSALLASVCASALKIPSLEGLIVRQRATRPQVNLNWSERQQNVAGAFALAPRGSARLAGYRSLLLIDDVSTSGATLEACAAPLYAAGVERIWGLVLARPDNLT